MRRVRPAHARRAAAATCVNGVARAASCSKAISIATPRRTLATELLVDPLVESRHAAARSRRVDSRRRRSRCCSSRASWTPSPRASSTPLAISACRSTRSAPSAATSARRELSPHDRDVLFRKVLANDAIEQVVVGPLHARSPRRSARRTRSSWSPCRSASSTTPACEAQPDGQLSLNLAEMQTIQAHFRELGRDPTDVELETIAQTWWSTARTRRSRAASTIATSTASGSSTTCSRRRSSPPRRRSAAALGDDDWCVSVFEDNAGVVRSTTSINVCFKVETHNHPSAIEPYGGANTGLGGVIRDPLGTGLGAKPICNTDVFCFAPPDTPPDQLAARRAASATKVMQGVVAGVRDYGNRMGIPTVNGAVCFDERYLGNPLVFCGTVGLIPARQVVQGSRSPAT